MKELGRPDLIQLHTMKSRRGPVRRYWIGGALALAMAAFIFMRGTGQW